MNEAADQKSNDEISMVDIYQFIKEGWKILFGTTLIGLLFGIIVAFILPEKFQASVMIEPARVAVIGVDGFTDRSLESKDILLEKMKSPTYYTDATVQACDLAKHITPFESLAKDLTSSAGRNSAYVFISFRAKSPAIAKECLKSVLSDVAKNQAEIAAPLINTIEVQLQNTTLELGAATIERDQQRIKNVEKLNVAKQKLAAAKDFINKFENNNLTFKFNDSQFSASALLLSTLLSKQNEIKDLEIQISALEMEVAANMTIKDQEVRKLATRVNQLQNALLAPSTKPASFASPIYTSNTKIEPKRGVIALVGLVIGIFLGMTYLIGRRVKKHLHLELEKRN